MIFFFLSFSLWVVTFITGETEKKKHGILGLKGHSLQFLFQCLNPLQNIPSSCYPARAEWLHRWNTHFLTRSVLFLSNYSCELVSSFPFPSLLFSSLLFSSLLFPPNLPPPHSSFLVVVIVLSHQNLSSYSYHSFKASPQTTKDLAHSLFHLKTIFFL